MRPPKLEQSAGRPKKKRIKSKDEPGKRGPYHARDVSSMVTLKRVVKMMWLNQMKTYQNHLLLKRKREKSGGAQDTNVVKKSRNKKKEVAQASTSQPPSTLLSSPGPVTRKRAAAMTPTGGSPSAITQDATPSRIKRRLLN